MCAGGGYCRDLVVATLIAINCLGERAAAADYTRSFRILIIFRIRSLFRTRVVHERTNAKVYPPISSRGISNRIARDYFENIKKNRAAKTIGADASESVLNAVRKKTNITYNRR